MQHAWRQQLKLMAITQRHLVDDLYATVEGLIEGGITALMLREKDLSTPALLELAKPLRELCSAHNVLFIVNGNLTVARSVRADGIHLGGDAAPLTEVAPQKGKLLVGVSAHAGDDLALLAQNGADYATLAPIFPPNSKQSETAPLGLEKLRELSTHSPIPIVALGGIDEARAQPCREAGAAGIAAIGSLMTNQPREAAARLSGDHHIG